MCNAVVLGAVQWHSRGVVTGDAPRSSFLHGVESSRSRAVLNPHSMLNSQFSICLHSFQSLQAIPDENMSLVGWGMETLEILPIPKPPLTTVE
mgnify:CR=1 FL=1